MSTAGINLFFSCGPALQTCCLCNPRGVCLQGCVSGRLLSKKLTKLHGRTCDSHRWGAEAAGGLPASCSPVVFSGSYSLSSSVRPHMADGAGQPDLLSTHQLWVAHKVMVCEGGPMFGGTHELLRSCSLAWWPLRQMAACPCSVTCHTLQKRKAEKMVSRAFSRESGTRPCHHCCFLWLSTTLGENKMLKTTSKQQKVQNKCNCSSNSNRLCLGTFFNRN